MHYRKGEEHRAYHCAYCTWRACLRRWVLLLAGEARGGGERVSEGPNVLQKVTPRKRRASALQDGFLESFARHGIVAKACRDAGITRTTLYRWKEHSNEFLSRYNLALDDAKDEIREEIRRRGQDGWDENVYQLGKHAGTVHKYSDTLLMFQAKALMPEYRDKQTIEQNINVTIKTEWGGGALNDESGVKHDAIS